MPGDHRLARRQRRGLHRDPVDIDPVEIDCVDGKADLESHDLGEFRVESGEADACGLDPSVVDRDTKSLVGGVDELGQVVDRDVFATNHDGLGPGEVDDFRL